MNNSLLSKNLKKHRKLSNLSQKDIANKIDISLRNYQYYESGNRIPPIDKLIIMADLFDVSIDYLVGRTDNPNINY